MLVFGECNQTSTRVCIWWLFYVSIRAKLTGGYVVLGFIICGIPIPRLWISHQTDMTEKSIIHLESERIFIVLATLVLMNDAELRLYPIFEIDSMDKYLLADNIKIILEWRYFGFEGVKRTFLVILWIGAVLYCAAMF